MKITILGCGGSDGVGLDGDWGDCDPTNPFNRRMRSSILVEHEDTRILVDCGPDFHEQCRLITGPLSAALFTHGHEDHIGGAYHLHNSVSEGQKLAIHADASTLLPLRRYADTLLSPKARREIKEHYEIHAINLRAYCERSGALVPTDHFQNHADGIYRDMRFQPNVLQSGSSFMVNEIAVTSFDQPHRNIHSRGFVFEAIVHGQKVTCAYSTDVSHFDMQTLDRLQGMGLDLWIVDSGKAKQKAGGHSWWEQTREWIGHVRPEAAFLTHLSWKVDYRQLMDKIDRDGFADQVRPAHDGMVIELATNGIRVPSLPDFNPRTSYNTAEAV